MKNLELTQMESLSGGVDNSDAYACGFGIGAAIFGFAVVGPVALAGLALCLTSDTNN